MTDIEKRAQKLLDDIQMRKNRELADKIFREPERRRAQMEAHEREEAEQLKRQQEKWNPYLEKAMQRVKQEQDSYEKLMNKFKS